MLVTFLPTLCNLDCSFLWAFATHSSILVRNLCLLILGLNQPLQLLYPTMNSTENSQPSMQTQELILAASCLTNEPTTPSKENGSICYKHPVMKSNKDKKYLGVRQRPSGKWVAEIKDSTQKMRLWLGTYDRAEDAAMAYDTASRLLRGRKAKTNFTYPKITTSPEENCSLQRKNPRLYTILRHAIMKNLAKSSTLSYNPPRYSWEEPIMEYQQAESVGFRAFFRKNNGSCSWSNNEENYQDNNNKICKLTLGSSKVYSSVVVAPSFSATQPI